MTYNELSNRLSAYTGTDLVVLAERLGPTALPYWTLPEPSLPIHPHHSSLWITPRKESYLLALMRTTERDCPILLGKYA
jgi:hypothetical protein